MVVLAPVTRSKTYMFEYPPGLAPVHASMPLDAETKEGTTPVTGVSMVRTCQAWVSTSC